MSPPEMEKLKDLRGAILDARIILGQSKEGSAGYAARVTLWAAQEIVDLAIREIERESEARAFVGDAI